MSITKSDFYIDRTLNEMQKLYSKKYGLVNKVSTSYFRHSSVLHGKDNYVLGNVIPMFYTQVKNNSIDVWNGGGASLSIERSKVKAYGEFIERYCATNFDNSHNTRIVYNNYNDFVKKAPCLDLSKFIHFEDQSYDQSYFPYDRYYPKKCISWVTGQDLLNNREIWIPAQKVFSGMKLLNNEQHYIQWLSTGLACGSNYYQAVNSAIYEVVERDSFMLTWLLSLPGTQIKVDKVKNRELDKLYKHIRHHLIEGDKLFVYDISKTSGIYTLLTFIKNNNSNAFGLIVSAASHLNPEIALLKSLEELCLTYAFAYNKLMGEDRDYYLELKKNDVNTLHKHTLFYCKGDRSSSINFISKSSDYRNISDMINNSQNKDEYDFIHLVDLFQRASQPLYAVDITKHEIQKLGFNVVRAIITGYNDLDSSHQFRLLKNNRLQEYKARYNASITSNPHPFP